MTQQNLNEEHLTTYMRLVQLMRDRVVRVIDFPDGERNDSVVGICLGISVLEAHPGRFRVNVELAGDPRAVRVGLQFCPEHVGDEHDPYARGIGDPDRKMSRWFRVYETDRPKRIYTVTAGPSREQLFDSLRLPLMKLAEPFTVMGGLRFEAYVRRIEVEIPNGEEWGIRLMARSHVMGCIGLSGTYNTKKREGELRAL
jgi:hypothetical protein